MIDMSDMVVVNGTNRHLVEMLEDCSKGAVMLKERIAELEGQLHEKDERIAELIRTSDELVWKNDKLREDVCHLRLELKHVRGKGQRDDR